LRLPNHFFWGNPVLETLLDALPASPCLSGWNIITTDSLDEVQDLLEALEDAGFTERRVIILGLSRFAVSWR
jgi:hypothetical protein